MCVTIREKGQVIGGRNKSKEKVHIWKRVIVWEGVRRQRPTDGEGGERDREGEKERKKEKKVGEREKLKQKDRGEGK